MKDNEKHNDEKYEELGQKVADFVGTSFDDIKDFLKQEKIFKEKSFFELFENNIPNFKNPMEDTNSEFRTTMDKIKDRFKKYKVEYNGNIEGHYLYEDDKAHYIEIEAVDYDKSEIKISVKGGNLSVSAQPKEDDKSIWKSVIYFSFYFDENTTDFKSITSSLNKGVLKIVVPKKQIEDTEEITIEIN